MPKKIEIGGDQYDIEDLSDASKNLVALLQMTEAQILEKTNLMAVFNKAKKAYIAEMKSEMLAQKAGLDFS